MLVHLKIEGTQVIICDDKETVLPGRSAPLRRTSGSTVSKEAPGTAA